MQLLLKLVTMLNLALSSDLANYFYATSRTQRISLVGLHRQLACGTKYMNRRTSCAYMKLLTQKIN